MGGSGSFIRGGRNDHNKKKAYGKEYEYDYEYDSSNKGNINNSYSGGGGKYGGRAEKGESGIMIM